MHIVYKSKLKTQRTKQMEYEIVLLSAESICHTYICIIGELQMKHNIGISEGGGALVCRMRMSMTTLACTFVVTAFVTNANTQCTSRPGVPETAVKKRRLASTA